MTNRREQKQKPTVELSASPGTMASSRPAALDPFPVQSQRDLSPQPCFFSSALNANAGTTLKPAVFSLVREFRELRVELLYTFTGSRYVSERDFALKAPKGKKKSSRAGN